jgi:hypothetical protein
VASMASDKRMSTCEEAIHFEDAIDDVSHLIDCEFCILLVPVLNKIFQTVVEVLNVQPIL